MASNTAPSTGRRTFVSLSDAQPGDQLVDVTLTPAQKAMAADQLARVLNVSSWSADKLAKVGPLTPQQEALAVYGEK